MLYFHLQIFLDALSYFENFLGRSSAGAIHWEFSSLPKPHKHQNCDIQPQTWSD